MAFWKFHHLSLNNIDAAEEMIGAIEIRDEATPATGTGYWALYVNEPDEDSLEFPAAHEATIISKCEYHVKQYSRQLTQWATSGKFWGVILVPAAVITALDTLVASLGPQCDQTSQGRTPLLDLGLSTYSRDGQGNEDGGLYGGGVNTAPTAHQNAGVALGSEIQKLDTNGDPSPSGKIVLLSVGMSNTKYHWAQFVSDAVADPEVSGDVHIINGAVSSFDAPRIAANINGKYWAEHIPNALSAAGRTAEQVQAIAMLQAIAGPTGDYNTHKAAVMGYYTTIVQYMYTLYPNLKQVWIWNRMYAGYAGAGVPSPEPYAYEQAFAIRQLILDQIAGEPDLNYDSSQGPVVAPWIAWGPDAYADGTTTRSDGLLYLCSDMRADDGMHPATPGAVDKVSDLLLTHFKTNSATTWFLA